MTRHVLALAATLSCLSPLAAQTTDLPVKATQAPVYVDWPEAKGFVYGKVIIVTNTQAGVRQPCSHARLTETTLSCRRWFHTARVVFNRSDVAALLVPRGFDLPLDVAFGFGIGGGIIYGGVALASITLTGGIPIIVLGTYFTLAWTGMVVATDNHGEYLLYQQPGAPLTVAVGHPN